MSLIKGVKDKKQKYLEQQAKKARTPPKDTATREILGLQDGEAINPRVEKKLAPLPQRAQRGHKGHWAKGVSGNSLGRPRSALSVLCRDVINKHQLVKVLGNIAARTGDYGRKHKDILITAGDQIAAIKLLLAYGYGVPKREIDTPGDLRIEVSYVNDNRRQINIAAPAPVSETGNHGVTEIQRSLVRSSLGEDDLGDGSGNPSRA
jgi:hypothetical protein